jgi:hypothetical protein
MKKCKKGDKRGKCKVLNYYKKIYPQSTKRILIWILGASIEVLGFFLLFAKDKILWGIITIIAGLLIALSSRGIK